jgi:hypothetical protein
MILQHVIKSSLLTITTRFQTNLLSDGALHELNVTARNLTRPCSLAVRPM